MRALYACSELGLGHAIRSMLLGKELISRGHDVSFAAGGNAHRLLKDEFKDVYYCTPVSWYETEIGVMPTISSLNIFIPLPVYDHKREKIVMKSASSFETINRYYDERKIFSKVKPDIVISDGDITSLRLAQRWKKTSIFITNLIRPNYDFPFNFVLYPGQILVERYIKGSDVIIIPDLPPPYTICEYNLGNFDRLGIRKKVKFLGPFLDMQSESSSEELIFTSITGPFGSKAKLRREIIPILSKLPYESVVSLGEPFSNFYREYGRCKIFGWLSEEMRKDFMKRAKVFIIPGSHGTCFETIKYRKPSICVPTQIEQKANAIKLKDLDCSLFIRGKNELDPAIKKIERDYDFYKSNIKKIGEYASRFNGLNNAADTIEGAL